MISQFIKAMEAGVIPDSAIRFGIRQLSKKRLEEIQTGSIEKDELNRQEYIEGLKKMPLAVHTRDANEQHYELPSAFFLHALGKNLKYSSCFWNKNTKNLDEAEDLALSETIKRAQITDGHRILELGCGWGSLTLEMGKRFPNSQIVAISNSSSQKAFIDSEANKRNLKNILVLTRDISQLESLALEFPSFDRVVSVEMFEHFKNYELLLSKIADVLTPNGKLFVHIFTHRHYPYPFETDGEDNWMGKYFFTGGQMPSHDLLMSFQKDLYLQKSWIWDGTHYEKTSNAWLENMDKNKEIIMPTFKETYGDDAAIWFQRWRVFFMACAELFGYRNGQEWAVSHYLFEKKMKIILIFLSGYFLNMFYITVLYHRAYAHGAIKVKPFMNKFFEKTAIWITGIDPLSWILMHRMHHKHSDQDKDPHSPMNGGIFSVFYTQYKSYRYYLDRLRLKDDPKLNTLISDVPLKVSKIDSNLPYFLHLTISILVIYFSHNWLMGAAYFAGIMSHPVQGWLINSIAHYYGGRNFNTDDNSKNNLLLAYLVFGEGLQNNHHAHPEKANFAHKFPEFDPGFILCKIGEMLGLLKI